MTAFLYHFHGIGDIDFSRLDLADLPRIQRLAFERDLEILPTVYLRPEALSRLTETVAAFGDLKANGEVPNIAGFAIEGPLLGPQGGIPRAGKWFPTVDEWRQVAALGPMGLRYVVMAPDAMALDDVLEDGFLFRDLLVAFYESGVRIALGHFYRDNPERSARRVTAVVDFLHETYESSPFLVLTDHLYNDMPRRFAHAWRVPGQTAGRAAELERIITPNWDECNLAELLGAVPAVMLSAARAGRIMPCLNFDGYHVDLEICRKTFEFLGDERLIALTDHTDLNVMAGESLRPDIHNRLWLRDDGAVAAGSSGYEVHAMNMRRLGISDRSIEKLFVSNPKAAIEYEVKRR